MNNNYCIIVTDKSIGFWLAVHVNDTTIVRKAILPYVMQIR